MSMIGKVLGNFECTALLGKGGMGEVYQAKDQKLGRDVAIKILPKEFAKDADRLARFQREAKLLASLNHPNIAAIYGLEESQGTHFLVLELVEGNTLADRVRKGVISVEEALKLSLQIAEALEAAHEKGIIHRDLKPANIKVTPDGKAKVLDFGLAKAFAGDQEDMNLSNSPTLSAAATQQGIILGTAAYMSPEQAGGEAVDKKTDIWAFGVVLFEMLAGRSLFEGNNVSQTLASVIKSEPEWKSLPPNLHPRIRLLLERCLEKESKNRYHDIADARVDIQKVMADPSGVFAQPVVAAKPKKRLRIGLSWFAVAIALASIIVGVAVWVLKPTEPRRVMRFDYELPENQQFGHPFHQALAVSPDGTQFVYSTTEGLYLRDENELGAKFIDGTDEIPTFPFFSPDGQWIGYFSRADRKLKKIAIKGGASIDLCDAADFTGASWGKDDMIVYGEYRGPIFRIPANGGNPELLVEPEGTLIHPQILPDGKTVMFTQWLGNATQVVVQSVETGERIVSFPGHSARYLPTGHIVYAVRNNLLAIPFDLDSLKKLSGGIPVVKGVSLNPDNVLMHYAVSESGTLAYIPEAAGGGTKNTLVWVDRSGTESPIPAEPRAYTYPRISPDGKQVALDIRDRDIDIWIWDFAGEKITRFTLDDTAEYYPFWSPDGEYIAFDSGQKERSEAIYRKASGNPTGAVELLTENVNVRDGINGYFFTPDSNFLVFRDQGSAEKGENIGMISLNGDAEVTWLLDTEYNERNAELSPDGKWIAYQSDQSGGFEIYVRPFPNVNEREWQISNAGGIYPLWSRNGDELFYIELGDPPHMVAVSFDAGAELQFRTPEKLLEWPYSILNQGRSYDVSPDGERFLAIDDTPAGEDAIDRIPSIHIVVNWFEELKERVPVD